MRTTLKLGVGHRIAVDGDGNGHGTLPPGLFSPVARYRQPGPSHPVLLLLGKVFLWLLALAGMAAGGLAGAAYLYFDDTVEDIVARTPEVKIAAKRLSVPLPDQAATALVIGYDKRLGAEREFEPRSDTIMLLRADPSEGSEAISMLSFPRDLWVEVRCPGRAYFPGPINEAYKTCQEQGVVETVKGLTGLDINYLITVNFRGFKLMVEKLGGVWIDVDRRYFNDNSGYEPDYATIDLKPGYQKLKGQDALDFVRFRHTDSDIHRTARQQAFVHAVKERLSASFKPSKSLQLVRVARAVTKNIEVAQGGGENVSGRTVIEWALFAYGLPSGRVFRTQIQGLYGTGTEGDPLTTDPSNIEAAVEDFLNPDVQAGEKAAAVALGQKPKLKTGPPPRFVSVVVLNGNGVEGSAASAGYALSQRLPHAGLLGPGAAGLQARRADDREPVRLRRGLEEAAPRREAAPRGRARRCRRRGDLPRQPRAGSRGQDAQATAAAGDREPDRRAAVREGGSEASRLSALRADRARAHVLARRRAADPELPDHG
jgi:LCP family protein required for cell wall assembly